MTLVWVSDMSTALVALIRHVIDVDSPNIHIRTKATKVRWIHLSRSLFESNSILVTSRRTRCSTIFQCCPSDHSNSKWKYHEFNTYCCEYSEHIVFRRKIDFLENILPWIILSSSIGLSFQHVRQEVSRMMIKPN